MKIVINSCYGGFSISPLAVQRLAELNGKKAYFFEQKDGWDDPYTPFVPDQNSNHEGWRTTAFDDPEPNERSNSHSDNGTYWDEHYLTERPKDRSDPKLVQVVEELGDRANGDCAKLHIVEIPDDIEWEIDEYDGMESISEKHRSWS